MTDTKKITTLPFPTGKGRARIENFNLGVFGMKGSRKTTFVEEVLIPKKKRLIIIDTLGMEYGNSDFCRATGIRYDGIYDDFSEFIKKLDELENKKHEFRLIYRGPREGFEAGSGKPGIPDVLKLLKFDNEKKRSIITNCTFVVEETTFFTSSFYVEDTLLDHFQYGRHNSNNLVVVARIPTEVSPKVRAALDYIVSMKQTDDRAIKFFADINSQEASRLRELEPGEPAVILGDEAGLLEFINTP